MPGVLQNSPEPEKFRAVSLSFFPAALCVI
jgi:hypothetical protein